MVLKLWFFNRSIPEHIHVELPSLLHLILMIYFLFLTLTVVNIQAAEKDGTNGAEVNVDEQVSLRRPERRKASGKDGSNEQPQKNSSRKNRRIARRKMRKTRAVEVADQGVTAENAEALGDWFFGEETGVKATASNEKAKVKQKRSRRRTRRTKTQTRIQQSEAEVDEL